ncbi:MAG: adenylosuccinate lyase, partial [Corynebacterium sp.]
FAFDGMCETFLTVLDEFGAFPAMIDRELERYLPFLATTRILMAAVRAGVGRETAHEVIKENAVAVALNMRENGGDQDLVQRLAADARLPLDEDALDAALADRHAFIGAAEDQVARVLARVNALVSAHPTAAAYRPDEIL